MAAPTLADLKEHLRVSEVPAGNVPSDNVLGDYLSAATEYVEDRCGPLTDTTVTVKARQRCDDRRLLLPLAGVADVVSLTDPYGRASAVDDTTGRPVDVDWRLSDLEAGVLVTRRTVQGTWEVGVTRTRHSDSQSLPLAVLIIAEHLLRTRRRPYGAGAPAPSAAEQTVPAGFAVPHRAHELMAAYRLAGGA